MKMRAIIVICFILSISLLSAQEIYGAFRIKTYPRGADVNLYDIDEYLCETPSPVFPVYMDDYLEFREGIPGREIVIMITKKGYEPLKKRIFVPFLYSDLDEAMDNPTVFKFNLKRDYHRRYYDVCWYYSLRLHRERPVYINWTPGYHPWYPHGHHHQNPPWNPGGHGHGSGHGGHGHGENPPPPPGDGHHDGGIISPPGGGNHGGGHDGDHDGNITPPVVPPGGGGHDSGYYPLDTDSHASGSSQNSRPPVKPDNPSVDKIEKDTRPVNIDRVRKDSGSVIVINKPQTGDKDDSPRVQKPEKDEKKSNNSTYVYKSDKKDDSKSSYQSSKSDDKKADKQSYKTDDKSGKSKDKPDKEDETKKDKKNK